MSDKIKMKRPTKPKWGTLQIRRPLPADFYGSLHRHGCRKCSGIVINCTCETPETDPLCELCLFGRRRSFWPQDHVPRDCCRAYSIKQTADEKRQRLLAGTRSWWRCEVCSRVHAISPSDPANDPPVEPHEWEWIYGELNQPPRTAADWVEWRNQ